MTNTYKIVKRIGLTVASAALCFSFQASAQQQQATSLDDLLSLVENAKINETQEQRDRVSSFQSNVNQRQSLLNDMNTRQKSEESTSLQLEGQYNENELIKADRYETLQERLGDLDELFGTIAGVVGDTRSQFDSSLISSQFAGRQEFLTDLADIMADDADLPSIEELERLWFYLQQEMTESGRIVKFVADVAQPDGTQAQQEVVRIGSYNILADGQYLKFNHQSGRLSILPSQPEGSLVKAGAALQGSADGFVQVGIDPTGPTGGSYLSALISSPTLRERIDQGRATGKVIIAVGIIGLLFALERMFSLTVIGSKVSRQVKNPGKILKTNPLGRVLSVYESDKAMDIETLELKLGEAILQETPKLERWLNLIKIIASVAPLLGLLGTVTGMIDVFQAITLFGTGDPQIMAGGISGALVTTVMGLCVAIPMVLMHTLLKTRSDGLIHVLEEQATGIIARKAEQGQA